MNQALYLPKELEVALNEQFFFPGKPLFGAIATIRENHPRIRTMRIYDFNQEGCPILLTHTGSNKWKEFVNHPNVSINLVSENKLTQIVVFGSLQLDTPRSSLEKATGYWNLVRQDVKKIYNPLHSVGQSYSETALTIPKEAPDSFGIACVIPSFWELLSLDSEYTKSQRYQFHWKGNTWQKERINVG